GRESFSPDASFYDGPLPANLMRFVEGTPNFAAEVRSEGDYTPAAELEIVAKRADYFAAGTQVVWDVDPIAETIDCYRADASDKPVRFVRGKIADAEPAVPRSPSMRYSPELEEEACMNGEREFLEAIVANPHDNDLRRCMSSPSVRGLLTEAVFPAVVSRD